MKFISSYDMRKLNEYYNLIDNPNLRNDIDVEYLYQQWLESLKELAIEHLAKNYKKYILIEVDDNE